ncbi:MAG: glycogen/starch synthase, partial [Synechococcus sp.]|nr:glycogen/starch synthase [Synechococcus sp.]
MVHDVQHFVDLAAETMSVDTLNSLLSRSGALTKESAGEDLAARWMAHLDVLTASAVRGASGEQPPTAAFAKKLLASNALGPVVFITPELGKWSTAGGLGVMVEELSCTLAEDLKVEDVVVISPFYEYGRKGEQDYLRADGIEWRMNVEVVVGVLGKITIGVHEGMHKGRRLVFLHHSQYFPRVYEDKGAVEMVATLALFAKASLEVLCHAKLIPSVILTNDWFTGLVPAYAKAGAFGSAFNNTSFVHILHNLSDAAYEGRVYTNRDDLGRIHHLPLDLLIDPQWQQFCLNPSRAALLACDTWATVSPSYRRELLEGSPLRGLLDRCRVPFATPNGVHIGQREAALAKNASCHAEAKRKLQEKYFGAADASMCILAFVGRLTRQKGV